MILKTNKFKIDDILDELPVQYHVIQDVKHDFSRLIRIVSSKKYESDGIICKRFYRHISKI